MEVRKQEETEEVSDDDTDTDYSDVEFISDNEDFIGRAAANTQDIGSKDKMPAKHTTPLKKKSTTGSGASKQEGSGRKVHQCTFVGCLYTTKYSKNLSRHMTKHTGEKPFSCQLCGNRFGRQDKLNRHMQVHTGYKPFPCGTCDYKAVDRSTLRRHMRIHTDERPYHCQICPYRSKDSSCLKVHLRTHTGSEKKYLCSYCQKTFSISSTRSMHEKKHKISLGLFEFKCRLCPQQYSKKSYLEKHMKTKH